MDDGVKLQLSDSAVLIAQVQVMPTLLKDIRAAQNGDSGIQKLKQKAQPDSDFRIDDDGLLIFQGRLVIPSDSALKAKILDIAHTSSYIMHPGVTKMYHDLR